MSEVIPTPIADFYMELAREERRLKRLPFYKKLWRFLTRKKSTLRKLLDKKSTTPLYRT